MQGRSKITVSMSSGSSVWQSPAAGKEDEFHYQTWRALPSSLALENNQFMRKMTEIHDLNADIDHHHELDDCEEYYYYRNKMNSLNITNGMPIPWNKLLEIKGGQQHHNSSYYVQLWQTRSNSSNSFSHDKWHKTLPQSEMLPRNEVLGGYIFVCNNETMQEDLHRQLFGLPQKYKDSVRAITPGLPLFLYNYTGHQLHGVFQAVSFGGSNIDPTAWQDKKCKGESRFPAQVRIGVKERCKPLEEDAFRPILYHYDGPKFRLQLSVPEALALLDLFKEENF